MNLHQIPGCSFIDWARIKWPSFEWETNPETNLPEYGQHSVPRNRWIQFSQTHINENNYEFQSWVRRGAQRNRA